MCLGYFRSLVPRSMDDSLCLNGVTSKGLLALGSTPKKRIDVFSMQQAVSLHKRQNFVASSCAKRLYRKWYYNATCLPFTPFLSLVEGNMTLISK